MTAPFELRRLVKLIKSAFVAFIGGPDNKDDPGPESTDDLKELVEFVSTRMSNTLVALNELRKFVAAPIPFPHQIKSAAWMMFREAAADFTDPDASHWAMTVRGGVLANDMGTGKTLTAILLIIADYVNKDSRLELPTLIIAPSSLLQTWEDEINKFAPREVADRMLKIDDRGTNTLHMSDPLIVLAPYRCAPAGVRDPGRRIGGEGGER
jgi:SNF2 family DNA or RNA helicase